MNPYLWLNDLLLIAIGAGLGFLLFGLQSEEWEAHSTARRVTVPTRR